MWLSGRRECPPDAPGRQQRASAAAHAVAPPRHTCSLGMWTHEKAPDGRRPSPSPLSSDSEARRARREAAVRTAHGEPWSTREMRPAGCWKSAAAGPGTSRDRVNQFRPSRCGCALSATPAFAAPSAPDHHLHGSLSPPRDPPSAPPTPAPPRARRPDLALACETLARGGGARFRGLASPDPHAHTQSPPLPDPRTALASLSRDFCRRLCGCADGRSRASWEGWGQREMGFSCLERCHIHSPTAGALAGAINLCHGPHLHHDLEAPSGLFVAQNCSFHMALEGVMGG